MKYSSDTWDDQLIELINKYPIPEEPIVPPEIRFPFMMIYYRKKPSLRNNNYLMAVAIFSISDYSITRKNLSHKGWSTETLMFDLPEFMRDDHELNRYLYYKFHDWDHISRILSTEDKTLLLQLKDLFPCKTVYLKEKNGQYKFIL